MAKHRFEDKSPPPPEDHSFVQDCGDPWGSAGNRPSDAFNDVSPNKWTRGGSERPNFDHGNSYRQGRNPKLRES